MTEGMREDLREAYLNGWKGVIASLRLKDLLGKKLLDKDTITDEWKFAIPAMEAGIRDAVWHIRDHTYHYAEDLADVYMETLDNETN